MMKRFMVVWGRGAAPPLGWWQEPRCLAPSCATPFDGMSAASQSRYRCAPRLQNQTDVTCLFGVRFEAAHGQLGLLFLNCCHSDPDRIRGHGVLARHIIGHVGKVAPRVAPVFSNRLYYHIACEGLPVAEAFEKAKAEVRAVSRDASTVNGCV